MTTNAAEKYIGKGPRESESTCSFADRRLVLPKHGFIRRGGYDSKCKSLTGCVLWCGNGHGNGPFEAYD